MAAAMAYLAASPSAPAAVVARLTAALISVRGGGPTDNAPWEDRPYTYEHPPQPPMGVVVGAGVVGAVTGEHSSLFFFFTEGVFGVLSNRMQQNIPERRAQVAPMC